MKSKFYLILLSVLLMAGTVFIIGTAMYGDAKEAQLNDDNIQHTPSIPSEKGVFENSHKADLFAQMPASTKELAAYYANRAYPGAPPTIPHKLLSEKGIGGKSCLQCHENGGHVAQFDAYSPITPHPNWLNCRQCHVPKKTEDLFKDTEWEKRKAPRIHQSAMRGSPPIMPHSLQNRENCLSCHVGPSAPKEIRVSHPERINCRQCHVPKKVNKPFERSGFTRPKAKSLSKAEVKEIKKFISKKTQKQP